MIFLKCNIRFIYVQILFDHWSSRTIDQKLWWPTPTPLALPLCFFVFQSFCLSFSYSKDGLSVFLIMQYSHIIFTIILYSQSTIVFNQKICGGSQMRTTGWQINTWTLRQILGGKQILPAGNRYKCGGSQSRMTMWKMNRYTIR